jgi:hypothetical protein
MQPPFILLILIVDRAHMICRGVTGSADLFRPTRLPLDKEIDDTPSPISHCIPDAQASRRAPLTPSRIPRGSRTRRSTRNALNRSGPSAAQLVPSGLVIVISQSRPRRLVVSDHCCSLASASTRIR